MWFQATVNNFDCGKTRLNILFPPYCTAFLKAEDRRCQTRSKSKVPQKSEVFNLPSNVRKRIRAFKLCVITYIYSYVLSRYILLYYTITQFTTIGLASEFFQTGSYRLAARAKVNFTWAANLRTLVCRIFATRR